MEISDKKLNLTIKISKKKKMLQLQKTYVINLTKKYGWRQENERLTKHSGQNSAEHVRRRISSKKKKITQNIATQNRAQNTIITEQEITNQVHMNNHSNNTICDNPKWRNCIPSPILLQECTTVYKVYDLANVLPLITKIKVAHN